jgi:hypothetical protein
MHGGAVEATNAPGGGLSVKMKLLLPGELMGTGTHQQRRSFDQTSSRIQISTAELNKVRSE